MLSLIKRLFGTANDRIINKLKSEVEIINGLEPEMIALSDEQLKHKTLEFKAEIISGKSLDAVLHRAYAVVREASRRLYDKRHYDVQIMGGIIMHRGNITEMRTGEGKTLVATLPAYLNALTGKGVHIVTVNDYLVHRDSIWMGKIYEFLGLSVGCVTVGMSDKQRAQAYACDITHATNNELGFDYLRDNMKFTSSSKVMREFNYAIIDEVDSILIDEARTPLIISGPVDDHSELYGTINKLILSIDSTEYEKDEKLKTVNLTEVGIDKVEQWLLNYGLIKPEAKLYDFDNLYLVHYINQALKAHFLFANDVDYLVRDGKVMIIDEFTGRVIEGRRYSDGLHQALEAKESVEVQNENQTLASITFQNYFRNYPKLAGMTGTAITEGAEFKDIYNLDVVAVPTHHPVKRKDEDDEIYGNKNDKYAAISKLVSAAHAKGQPVLIGTVSIEKSEEVSALLKSENIPHKVLNAKFHEQEAYIIAQAGRFGSVTIATNMAGRGTDIMLGGNPEMLIEAAKLNSNSELDIQRIEAEVNLEKAKVIEAGGLYVIGTERHESRRIDNQLRGRSGRQGDPGSSKFFLSLDDDLMRIFASERISGMLRSLGLKDGEAIMHPMISSSLSKAQQKVEGHNYEIRKNLLKFDNVMNQQRKIIYQQRNDIMATDNVQSYLFSMAEELVKLTINNFIKLEQAREEWDLDALSHEIYRLFSLKLETQEILPSEQNNGDIEVIYTALHEKVTYLYQHKETTYGKELLDEAMRYILLSTLDQVWKDHLHNLDYLKQGISLRAYGQKDPLNEYKREAYKLFETMLDNMSELFVQRISFLQIDADHLAKEDVSLEHKQLQEMHENREATGFEQYNAGSAIEVPLKASIAYVEPENRDPLNQETWGKIGRNELCPCGSGKKYKHCHG